jgi:hypothetical protein
MRTVRINEDEDKVRRGRTRAPRSLSEAAVPAAVRHLIAGSTFTREDEGEWAPAPVQGQ